MAKKLYVGSLSYDTNDESLKNAFSQAGSVTSATVVVDRMSGRSRGFGFVEMATDEEAKKAIEQFDNSTMEDRTIHVKEAYPETQRDNRE